MSIQETTENNANNKRFANMVHLVPVGKSISIVNEQVLNYIIDPKEMERGGEG